MTWQYENTGLREGSYNMEYDEAIAAVFSRGTRLPTLRVYGWEPAAISLGWSQSMEELDLKRIAQEGIGVVRRPTGGRAILHSEEVTYSVVMNSNRKRVLQVYDEISRALVRGLRNLGVDAQLEKCQPSFRSEYAVASSAACFTSTAKYEVQVAGRKVIGSAQRRYGTGDGDEVVLQHGSILLGPDHRRIVDFLNLSHAEKVRTSKALEERTTDLSHVLGRHVEFHEVADAVKQGFEETMGITFEMQPQLVEALV